MLKRLEQKGTKAAPLAAGQLEVILFQKPREKILRQILRVVRTVTPTPDVSIQRRPISAAQTFQRGLGAGLRRFSGEQDDTPMGGVELARHRWRVAVITWQ